MASEHREDIRIIRGAGIEEHQRVVEAHPSTQRVVLTRGSRLIWFIVAGIMILIGFRFALMLLAANPSNDFTDMVYNITNIFVAPFVGLVQSPTFAGGSVIDVPSIFALVVYPLIGWGIVELLHIFFGDTGGIRRVKILRRTRTN